MKRWILLLALLAGAAAAQPRPADYPTRPLRMISGGLPGSQSDLVGRYIAERLAARLGQPVVMDIRNGANGAVALEYMARQPPDGHTIFYGAAAWVVSNIALQPSLPFDMLRDFRPVTRFGVPPQCLIVRAGLPVRSAREFFALAAAQPGRLTYASFGIGSTSHLQMEFLKHMTRTDLLHVPFRGSAPAMQEVAAGRVDAFLIDFAPSRAFLESGQARCLAITGQNRWPEFPDVPTFAEAGYPLELIGWHAFFVQAAVPDAIVEFLHAEVSRIVQSEEGRAALLRLGLFPVLDGPAETARIHRADLERWREAVRISGARPE